ncbi:MAG: hypothetical protein Q7J84_14675 [Sulfuricaulis sp.]|nr:hypothetical protein [Sulfuricaulis sp.]
MVAMRTLGIFLLLLATGCVGVERSPPPAGAAPAETVAVEPSASRPTEATVTKVESPKPKVPVEQPAKKSSASPSLEKKKEASPLDLTALETRLKETKAIGVFTKIALKNQFDDLLNQFRAYYQGRVKTTLAELRQPYDMLLLKVLTLLQDDDPELARAMVTSREAIWSILADPAKFATL